MSSAALGQEPNSGPDADLQDHSILPWRARFFRIEDLLGPASLPNLVSISLTPRLKDWRRIHTRYDRCAHTFMSAICLAVTVIFWLN
jgi:transposase